MKLNQIARCLGLAFLAISPLTSQALGLGQANVMSSIGQPLIAEVELLADPSEVSTLRMVMAQPTEYQVQGIEFNPVLTNARVVVKKNEAGKTVALITTTAALSEPYIQVILDGETINGKVRRAYSLFIDPSRRALTKLPGEASYTEVNRPVTLPTLASSTGTTTGPSINIQAGKPLNLSGAVITLTNIDQMGQPPAQIEPVKGYGRKQSMRHVLFTIVPKGWKGYANDVGTRFSDVIDWTGGQNWLVVLDGVLASANMTAVVDWSKKEITFSRLGADTPGQAPNADAPAPAAKSANNNVDRSPTDTASQQDTTQAQAVRASTIALAKATAEAVRLQAANDKLAAELSSLKAAKDAVESKLSERAAKDEASRNNEQTAAARQFNQKIAQLETDLAAAKSAGETANKNLQLAKQQAAEAQTLQASLARSESVQAQAKTRIEQLEKAAADNAQKLTASEAEAARLRSEKTATIRVDPATSSQLEAALAERSALQSSLKVSRENLSKEEALRAHFQTQNKRLGEALNTAQERLSAYTSEVQPRKADAVIRDPRESSAPMNGALASVDLVQSSGLNVALSNAIKQIVPQGWMVISDPAIANVVVAWTGGGRPWTQVLGDMLKEQSLKAKVDAANREVTIGR